MKVSLAISPSTFDKKVCSLVANNKENNPNEKNITLSYLITTPN